VNSLGPESESGPFLLLPFYGFAGKISLYKNCFRQSAGQDTRPNLFFRFPKVQNCLFWMNVESAYPINQITLVEYFVGAFATCSC
jgi:hypothetical protein